LQLTNNVFDGSGNCGVTFASSAPITLEGTSRQGSILDCSNSVVPAITVLSMGYWTMQHLTVRNGNASQGSAIYTQSVSVQINDVTFQANSALEGGALYFKSGSYFLNNVSFIQNSARTRGGAIFLSSAYLQLSNSNFDCNLAGENNGGSAVFCGNASITLNGTSISTSCSNGASTSHLINCDQTCSITTVSCTDECFEGFSCSTAAIWTLSYFTFSCLVFLPFVLVTIWSNLV